MFDLMRPFAKAGDVTLRFAACLLATVCAMSVHAVEVLDEGAVAVNLEDCLRRMTTIRGPNVNWDNLETVLSSYSNDSGSLVTLERVATVCQAYARAKSRKDKVRIDELPTKVDAATLNANVVALQKAYTDEFRELASKLQRNLVLAYVCANATDPAIKKDACDRATGKNP